MLRFGYFNGTSGIMRDCQKSAGDKWMQIEGGKSVKELYQMFEVKAWADEGFNGWEDMRLRPKWCEFK